jgi:hypothetical protein
MLDEDDYAEIRWFTNPAALAEDITAAISAIPSVLAPAPLHGQERAAPPADGTSLSDRGAPEPGRP